MRTILKVCGDPMKRDDVHKNADCLKEQLGRDGRAAGKGALEAANRMRIVLGLDRRGNMNGALDYPRTTANPSCRGLAAVASGLGTDLVEICARVARYSRGPIAEFITDGDRLLSSRKREKRRLPKALVEARKRISRTNFPFDDYGGVDVGALNEQRFDKPRLALRSSYSAIHRVSGPAATADVLGVLASNLRECLQLELATLALCISIPAADLAGSRGVLGRLVHAAGGVSLARGNFELARRLIDEAEAIYCRCRDQHGRATAMLDRACCVLMSDGKTVEAFSECDAALALLPEDAVRPRSTAHQLRGLGFLYTGRLAEAADSANRAILMAANHSMQRGRIRWLQARVASKQGLDEQAVFWFQEAYRLLTEPAADRLLIVAQLIQSFLHQGKLKQAREAVQSHLSPLFGAFSHDTLAQRIFSAAYATLFRASLEADLSTEVVEHAICKIEAGRASYLNELRDELNHR